MMLHQLFTAWKGLQQNWFIGLVHKFVLLLFIVSILFLVWRWNRLPTLVPLWYSLPWGHDQLAHPLWLILLPIFSLIWYGINILISVYLLLSYLVFAQMLFLTSLIVSILSFLALIKILFLIS